MFPCPPAARPHPQSERSHGQHLSLRCQEGRPRQGIMLLHLIAGFALAVAVLYGFIGVYVVPKLARLADRDSGLIRAAQYGAAAFFVGCAMTHIALAEHVLAVPELVRGHEWAHLLPHVAQVIGGGTFAVIA